MRSSTKLFFDVVYYFLSSLVTGPSFMSISSQVLELWQFSFLSDWTEIQKSELVLSDVFPIPGDWSKLGIPNLAQMSLMKCYWMLRKKKRKIVTFWIGKIFYSLLLLSGGLGLIGHPLVFHGCRVLQQNKFSFHQKYLCYPGYFQEGNGF